MAMSMWLADENDRKNLHPTLQNVNSVLKIQERFHTVYILSNVSFYNLSYSLTILSWQLQYPGYFA